MKLSTLTLLFLAACATTSGYVYVYLNSGTNEDPRYEQFQPVVAIGKSADVNGSPRHHLPALTEAAILICGEFLDGLTCFQNTGTGPILSTYPMCVYLMQTSRPILRSRVNHAIVPARTRADDLTP